MKNKYLITVITLITLCIYKTVPAQDCNANFTYSIDTENGHIVSFLPNGLSSTSPIETFWFIDGLLVGLGPDIIYTFEESGTYTVCLKVVRTDIDTCIRCIPICVNMATSEDLGSTSVESTDIDERMFDIYPNPSKDNFTIQLISNEIKPNTALNFKIMDLEGRILKTFVRKTIQGNNTINIDMADFPKGIYFINIEGEQIFETLKAVKM